MENNNEIQNSTQVEENQIETYEVLNEISYKMDSLVYRQEEQTSAISQGFGLLTAFIVIYIIYSFIKSFIDF